MKSTQGFSGYLESNQLKPRGFILHYPLEKPRQFYQELKAADDIDSFIQTYRHNTLRNVPITAFVLGVSAAGWQLAANFSDKENMPAYSIITGFSAALFLNLSYCLFLPKSKQALLTSSLAKLGPAWLADGLWMVVWQSTDKPGLHFLLFLAVGILYLTTQTLLSRGLNRVLRHCQPELTPYLPTTTWSTPVTLAWGHWGFGYLMPLFQKLPSLPAAFLSAFLPVLTHRLVVDLVVSARNSASLKKRYREFDSIPEKFDYQAREFLQSINHSDTPPARSTPCLALSQSLRFCFNWICCRDENSRAEHANILA